MKSWLYFHIINFLIFAIFLFCNPIYLWNRYEHLFGDASYTLNFILGIIYNCTIIGYTSLILYGIRHRCRDSLRFGTRCHLTLFCINFVCASILKSREQVVWATGWRIAVLIVILYMLEYICYSICLLTLYEKLNKEQGFPNTKRVFGVHINKFMYIHLTLIWLSKVTPIVSSISRVVKHWDYRSPNGFDCVHDQKGVPTWEEFDACFAGYWPIEMFRFLVIFIGLLSASLLHIGLRKRDRKFLKIYRQLQTFCYICIISIESFLIMFRPVTHSEVNFYTVVKILMITYVLNMVVLDIYLPRLYINLFICEKNELLGQQDVEARRLKLFTKFAKMDLLRVTIDEGDDGFLGEGRFGTVRKGTISRSSKGVSDGQVVAVKFLSSGFTSADNFKSIASETKLTQILKIGHPNIIRFYGVTHSGISSGLGIVMEYCERGCLQKYLRSLRNTVYVNELPGNVSIKLEQWSLEIASAMEFLSNLKIIHGDLATRNVLLDGRKCAMLADFGMSTQLYYQLYIKSNHTVFPWRWMAPESLSDLKFSVKSDVWSYGVFLWEMYTLGDIPWAGVEWTSDFVSELKAGNKLLKPSLAPDKLYEDLIVPCWNLEDDKRWTFTEIWNHISHLHNINPNATV